MLERIKVFIKTLQEKGVPLFFIRNNDGKPSITLTTVVISFIVCLAALVDNVSTSKLLGGLNFDNCLNLYVTSMILYLGRSLQKGGLKSDAGTKEQ